MTTKHKPRRQRYQRDPLLAMRMLGMQQPFTPAEQVQLNLPVREALQSLRDGTGTDVHWNTLAAVVNVCLLRGERISPQVVDVAKDGQAAVLDVLARHQRTGVWGVAHDDIARIDACIDLHEQLVALSTPAQMMQAMRDTLARMNAGHVHRVEHLPADDTEGGAL